MSDDTIEIFIAAYDTEGGAAAALKDFKAAQREGAIDLIDGAVIVHKADGKVHYDETADPSTRRWTKRGVIAGGVVGLIFPPSLIASAVVGAGAGGIWGKIRDKGFKDDDLKEVGESLRPVPRRSSRSRRTGFSSSWSRGCTDTSGSPSRPCPRTPPR